MRYDIRRRANKLTRKFTTSPMWPVLGWTKFVESWVTSSGHLLNWLAYAAAVTILWTAGVVIWEMVQEAADEAAETIKEEVNE